MYSSERDLQYPDYKTQRVEKYKYVTTWCSSHFPKFDEDKIIDSLVKSGTEKEEDRESIKKTWRNTAKYGKAVHTQIENYYSMEELKRNILKPFAESKQFIKFAEDIEGYKWTPFACEWKIYHEELKLCGKIDMVYQKSDKSLVLIDWKTSKKIRMKNQYQSAITECIKHFPDCNFFHYSLQLNYYKFIVEDKYKFNVSEMYIVLLKEDDYELYEVDNLQEEIRKLNILLLADN